MAADQMAEAMQRQRDHAYRSLRVDRRGWTDEQWADDAERIMHDLDGAITSLVNGHALSLIRERNRLRDELHALRCCGERVEDCVYTEAKTEGWWGA